jgi:glycosyltransferase involved in cell wall biosynthesis
MKMRKPKISILLVGRNAKDELPRLLDSFNRLTYPRKNYEIVFVDDGSTDGSWKIAKKFGARVFRFEKRQGRARVRNKALRMARYPIIAWIDSDGEIKDPRWIENMLKYLKGDVIGVAGDQLKPLGGLARVIWYMPGMAYLAKKPKEATFAPTTSSLFVKKPLLEVGGFDEKLITAEDLEICWRLAKKGYRFMQIPNAAIVHHFRSTFRGFARQQWERGVFGGYMAKMYERGLIERLINGAIFLVPAIGFAALLWPQIIYLILAAPLVVHVGLGYFNFFPKVLWNYMKNEKNIVGMFQLIAAEYIKTFALIGGLLEFQIRELKR